MNKCISKNGCLENKKEKNALVQRHSHTHRFLHFFFSLLSFALLLFLLSFFNQQAQGSDDLTVKIISPQKISVTNEFGEKYDFNKSKEVFEGETFSTSIKSQAVINFPDKSELRLHERSRVKILSLKPNPEILLLRGQIWVFATSRIIIRMPKSMFIVEGSSADFVRNGSLFEIASFRHNLRCRLFLSDEDKNFITNFMLPVGNRVIFSPLQIKEELSLLRFSKLKKELKFHTASETDWDTQNLLRDRKILLKIEENYVTQAKTNTFFAENFLLFRAFKNALTFIPAKKEDLKQEKNEFLIKEILKNYFQGKSDQAQSILKKSNFQEDNFSNIWKQTFALSSYENFLKARWDLEEIWLQKITQKEKKIELLKDFLIASFSLIEDFVKDRNEKFLKKEIAHLRKLLNSFEKYKYKNMLFEITIGREVISNLAKYFADRVSEDILQIYEWSNDISLMHEDSSTQDILRLEIAQSNLTLMEKFIKKERFLLAKKIIEQTDERLRLETMPEIFSIREKILSKKSLVNQKLAYVENEGQLNEESFQQFLKDQEKTDQLIEELELSQKNKQESEIDTLAVSKEELFTQVREKFAENEITLVSFDFEEYSEDLFLIYKAVLSNGDSFSALYDLSKNSLSEIEFEDYGSLAGGVFLSEIVDLSRKFSGQNNNEEESDENSDNDLYASADESKNTEDIDSALLMIIKQLAQKKLSEKNIKADLKDIKVITRDIVKISNAKIDEIDHFFDIKINIKTDQCSDIKIDQEFDVPETNLASLYKAIISFINKKEQLDEFKKTVSSDFKILKIDFVFDENLQIDQTKKEANFSELIYSLKEKQYIISGQFDIKNKIFKTVSEKTGQFNLENIESKDFETNISQILEKKQQEEAAAIDLKEDNLPENKVLKEKEALENNNLKEENKASNTEENKTNLGVNKSADKVSIKRQDNEAFYKVAGDFSGQYRVFMLEIWPEGNSPANHVNAISAMLSLEKTRKIYKEDQCEKRALSEAQSNIKSIIIGDQKLYEKLKNYAELHKQNKYKNFSLSFTGLVLKKEKQIFDNSPMYNRSGGLSDDEMILLSDVSLIEDPKIAVE